MAPIVHDSALPWMESGAVIKLNADGSADFLTPVTENGNAAITSQTQVVSEASGIPFEDINVIFGDTEATPFDFMGQVGSSTAHIRSIASKRAGEDARKQLIERASDQMGEKPENLDIENGRILLKSDQETYITIKEIMSGMLFGGVEPVVGRGTARTPHYPERAYNFGAHFSLVEVNTITGEVKILKYVAAHDVGRALNLHAVESQIQGGVLMGLGQVFTEAIIFDSKGKPRNNQYADYKIATAADYPDIEPIVVETDDPISAYGAKGFSEAPLVGVPGCVVNAIYNAIGIRFDTLPILPERVIERLKLNV
jgi:CO/xanthine dehydrogenase Mo-binding subunit